VVGHFFSVLFDFIQAHICHLKAQPECQFHCDGPAIVVFQTVSPDGSELGLAISASGPYRLLLLLDRALVPSTSRLRLTRRSCFYRKSPERIVRANCHICN
jgi:hypothetical protein